MMPKRKRRRKNARKRSKLSNATDTIAALATPPGVGGVGIVRLSGPNALSLSKKITHKTLSPRRATYTVFQDKNNRTIDQGVALYFKAPHSFTGEDVVELQGHGGPVVINRLLQCVLEHGARMARPGEFSERAFLNNKIDLTQAEAIADLINASSEQAAKSAVRSLEGDFSNTINALLQTLIQLRMMVESSIDFPEEEIDFLTENDVLGQLQRLLNEVESVERAAKNGVLLQTGMTAVIAGKPNAGKSSLMNCLSGRDSAIVTELAGTTRDVLREHIHLDGMPLYIVDTAGLHDTDNVVEAEGIRRALNEIEKADVVLLIVDSASETAEEQTKTLNNIRDKIPANLPVMIVNNKIDLTQEKPRIDNKNNETHIYISAKQQDGVQQLKQQLKTLMGFDKASEDTFIARQRHVDAIARTKTHLEKGLAQLKNHKAGELLAEDLRQAQTALSEITGAFTSDDLLGQIFSSFCIGK